MIRFLVRWEHFLVFLAADPAGEGGPVPAEPVVLDAAHLLDHRWGQVPVGICVGADPAAGGHYRLFPSAAARAHAGFRQVVGMPAVAPTWADFVRAAADCGEVIG